MTRRRRKTVEEVLADYEADPVWRAEQEASDREIEARAARFDAEERPLVADLRKAGFRIDSLQELFDPYADRPWARQPQDPYPEAIPVLFEHLKRPYSTELRDMIARTMAVPDSGPWWHELKQMFVKENDERVRSGLACVISVLARFDKALLPDVIELMRDRGLGTSRILMVDVLTHHAPRVLEAERALQELKSDPDLEVEIGRRLHEREVRRRRKARGKRSR